MTIEKLTEKNWVDYKSLRLEALRYSADAYFASYDQVVRWSDHSFRSEIAYSPESLVGYYGVIYDGHLVAYGALLPSYFSKQSHTIELSNLYVTPTHRGKGIARSLINHLIATLANQSIFLEVFLHVVATNVAALHLYESSGFVRVGVKQRAIRLPSGLVDEYIYQRSLGLESR